MKEQARARVPQVMARMVLRMEDLLDANEKN
jgi:hypothetical protein